MENQPVGSTMAVILEGKEPQTAIVAPRMVSAEEVALVKQTIFPDATQPELKLYLLECQRRGVHPLDRRIHPQVRTSYDGKRSVTFVTSIDHFRDVAIRTGQHNGLEGPLWCGEDGKWNDVWVSGTPLVASLVRVYRKGSEHPFTAIARFEEYVQRTKGGVVTSMWQKMPTTMLAKCAEALALRKAFPQELGGLYTGDEMLQATVPEEQGPFPSKNPARRYVRAVAPATVQPKNPPLEGQNTSQGAPAGNAGRPSDDQASVDAAIAEAFPESESVVAKPKRSAVKLVADCAQCGEGITDAVMRYSQKQHGQPLCFSCQKKFAVAQDARV